MVKSLVKNALVSLVIGLVVIPTSLVQAASMTDYSNQLIDNVMNAKSVDFKVDVDIETKSDSLTNPVKIHADVDGVSDSSRNGSYDLHFWTTDSNNKFYQANGSVVVTADTLYFSEDGKSWYFLKYNLSPTISTKTTVNNSVTEFKSFMQDMFNYGVIEYRYKGVALINSKVIARYAYSINNDKFVDYLVTKGLATKTKADEIRAQLKDRVTIGGSIWVDTLAMLPAMITMNINTKSSSTSYTNVALSVLFNSFNQPVIISVPANAVDMKSYKSSSSVSSAVASLESSVSNSDTDGDGLSNIDEETIWMTNPLSSDTDGDGYPDNTEVINGYNPNGTGKLDSDGDGLSDYRELTVHYTNRFDSDSDNDSYNDGLEITHGYNPNGPGKF